MVNYGQVPTSIFRTLRARHYFYASATIPTSNNASVKEFSFYLLMNFINSEKNYFQYFILRK